MFEQTKLLDFLDRLDEVKIYYRLKHARDSICVEVAVPYERWEVEFMRDGSVVIEKFTSDAMYDESEIEVLFRDFSEFLKDGAVAREKFISDATRP